VTHVRGADLIGLGRTTVVEETCCATKGAQLASVMERTPFTIATGGGELSGWVSGAGPGVLAIHGGPGMNFGYLDDAVAELAAQYEVATFQQRGLAPSTEQGEFTIAEAVADIAPVMDGLGWTRPT
jgi:pimeloyl-ACP methyl ester carboxylesterase